MTHAVLKNVIRFDSRLNSESFTSLLGWLGAPTAPVDFQVTSDHQQRAKCETLNDTTSASISSGILRDVTRPVPAANMTMNDVISPLL